MVKHAFCIECGTELVVDAKFCSKCGRKVESELPSADVSSGVVAKQSGKSPKGRTKRLSNQNANGFWECAKGCLPIVIGIIVAVKFFNSCSCSKSREDDQVVSERRPSTSIESDGPTSVESDNEKAKEAMAVAYILGALAAAEERKTHPSTHTYECIYCGKEAQSKLRLYNGVYTEELPDRPHGSLCDLMRKCPESRSGQHQWRRCREVIKRGDVGEKEVRRWFENNVRECHKPSGDVNQELDLTGLNLTDHLEGDVDQESDLIGPDPADYLD